MSEPVGRRLRRFASFNVAQQVWLAGLSVVATPILYHRLGEGAYGLLAVVNLISAQLAILEFGFGHATIRRLSRSLGAGDTDEIARTLSTSFWVFLGTALVGMAVMLLATDVLAERYFQIPPELLVTGKTALRIGAIFFMISVFGNLSGAVWQGLQRFGYLNLASGIAATAQLLGGLVLVLLGYGVLHVLSWTVFLGFIALAVDLWWLRRGFPGLRLFARPDGPAFREMAGFGLLLMLAGVFTQIFISGGGLVLGHFVVVGALPLFTIPFGIFLRLQRTGFGLASALYPLVAEMDGRKDEATLQRVFLSGTRLLLLVGTAAMVPAVLLARPVLSLWMGRDFATGGGAVLELFLASFVLSFAATPSIELARGRGRGRPLVVYTAILAGVGLLGTVLAAPVWGAVGAAAAFFFAQSLGSGFIIRWAGGAGWKRVLDARVITVVALAASVAGAGLAFTSFPAFRVGLAAVAGMATTALAYGWVLSDVERRALRALVARS